jgi:uncharacterized membrane protein
VTVPHSTLVLTALLLGATAAGLPHTVAAQTVRAVLFHSPTCPHCRQVITEDLPLFYQVYGGPPQTSRGDAHLRLLSNGTLTILFVDVSDPAGTALFDASYESHPMGADRRSVPRMIVGDSVMVGSIEIPGRLHGLIRAGLANGGTPWPEIRGLEEVTGRLEDPGTSASADTADTAGLVVAPGSGIPAGTRAAPQTSPDPGGSPARDSPAQTTADTTDTGGAITALQALGTEPATTVGQRVRRDRLGNGLAIVGLGVMVLTLAAVGAGVPARVGPRDPGLWLPLLAVIGAGVAAYLTYIETSGAAAVCGPVGDCNTVQQSEYARLFGAVPVGALGLAGYGIMVVLWVLGQDGRPTADLARRVLVVGALLGTLFSVYLTVLEPFVIGATCLWCLSSAGIMTALLWLASAWAKTAGVDFPSKSL